MKLFALPFDKLIIRFYLLMAVVIVPFFIGIPALAILALPVFLTSILGVEIKKETDKAKKGSIPMIKYPNLIPTDDDYQHAA